MPYLDLTDEMIGPKRTRLSLTYIEGVMLWPHDEAARKSAWDTAYGAHLLETLAKAAPRTESPVPVDARDALLTMNFLANARPLPEVQESAKAACARGFVAGEILRLALTERHSGAEAGITAIKSKIAEGLQGKEHFERLSLSTIENSIWRIYRPVSHLYAASFMLAQQHIAASQPHAFPCRLDELPDFLALSEKLRLNGEGHHPRQYAGTLLDPETTWAVPANLSIPEVTITWNGRSSQAVF
ncbi:hypothetical protein [Limobrevibacterium gyesilva]|nr:hypothetical protein [Limobrevibacterium gyesilva]